MGKIACKFCLNFDLSPKPFSCFATFSSILTSPPTPLLRGEGSKEKELKKIKTDLELLQMNIRLFSNFIQSKNTQKEHKT
ncbi:hypothetical protein L8106_16044 [Lyngbya sp. PCC 8106]|nr:hypothetical protein L8106_16044 [Lyngbya sp. PCC 8106]